MIRINVFILAKAGNKEAVVDIAKELVKESLTDTGCVAYDLFESSTREDVLMICETWQDEATLAAHEAAPHFVNLVPKLQNLADLKLEKFHF